MKFKSIELQNAFDKAKPVLENISQTMDTISNEIRMVEKFLQDQAICENFILKLPTTKPLYDENAPEDGLFILEKRLLWNKEKKRIIYIEDRYNISDEDNYKCFGDSLVTMQNKPLIETSFEIRKMVYEEYLSKFLLGIANTYELPNQANDPPF